MRGSIVKRGRRYSVVVDVGRDESGKRIRKWHSGFERRRDAERALAKILAQLDSAAYVEPAKLTVERFLVDEWLPAVERTLRPLSVTKYQSVNPLLRHATNRSRALTGTLGGSFERALHRVGARGPVGLDAKARPRRNRTRLARRGAVGSRHAQCRPARPTHPAPPSRGRSAWTAGELRRFLVHVADDRLFALWRLAVTTGMRRGELAGLTWRAVDIEGAQLSVEQQLVPTRGGCTFGPPKSDSLAADNRARS